MFSTLLEASAQMSSPLVAKTPMGCGLNGEGAAALLAGFAMKGASHAPRRSSSLVPRPVAEEDHDDDQDQGDESHVTGVSRKEKSLGLLCDNFLQLFASGHSTSVELENVATQLGVGRRRIYDIVNVLESLDVVQKDRASAYTWLGISKLPARVEALTKASPVVPLLFDEPGGGAALADTPMPSMNMNEEENNVGNIASHRHSIGEKVLEGRKEKSIRELATKFVSLFLQSTKVASLDGTISLEQAARSLLMHENGMPVGGPEPDAGAMKTKVRRLYDICNVLTSLKMITKVRLPDTSKPAFKWHGVTDETKVVFDAEAAANRQVKAYGGGVNAPVCAKRRNSAVGAESKKQKWSLSSEDMAGFVPLEHCESNEV